MFRGVGFRHHDVLFPEHPLASQKVTRLSLPIVFIKSSSVLKLWEMKM